MNDEGISLSNIPPDKLAAIIEIVDKGEVSFSNASSKLLPAIITNNKESIVEIASRMQLIQTKNTDELKEWVTVVLNKMPDKVSEYKKGKKGLMGLFVGEIKKLSKGKADLKSVTQMLEEELS